MTLNFSNLKDLDLPVKVLFTGYLTTVAVGYFFALIQILFTHGMADGQFGLSIDDIVYSYYGNRSGTMLETKLNGTMKDKASEQERFTIIQWVRDGADKDKYEDTGIKQIIETRCVMCHSSEASGIPDFTDVETLKKTTEQDEGATFSSLTRVSHIHLFGISFIFMFVGLIFSFAETPTTLYKCVAIGMPYLFLLIDILSWWLTKISPMFAWLVIFAGMGMGVSFISMWVISLFVMWVFKTVFLNKQGERYQQWSIYAASRLKTVGLDDINSIIKILGKHITTISELACKFWMTQIWPLFKKQLSKIKSEKNKLDSGE